MKTPAAFCRSSPRQPPPWIELPDEVTANILRRLSDVEILENAEKVCTIWRRICQDPSMWQVIHVEYNRFSVDQYQIWRRAVDLSQGQLVDFNMDYIGNDDLLNYIVDRSSRLRRINLYSCCCITGKGLADAVKKLPDLEEICISMFGGFSAADIQSIGTSCPNLKSFKYVNFNGSPVMPYLNTYYGIKLNDDARTIAASMPNLHQLTLCGDWLDYEGLVAILNAVPTSNQSILRRALARLSDQIKHVRYPTHSCSDIEWLCSDYGFENTIPPESLQDEDEVFS